MKRFLPSTTLLALTVCFFAGGTAFADNYVCQTRCLGIEWETQYCGRDFGNRVTCWLLPDVRRYGTTRVRWVTGVSPVSEAEAWDRMAVQCQNGALVTDWKAFGWSCKNEDGVETCQSRVAPTPVTNWKDVCFPKP